MFIQLFYRHKLPWSSTKLAFSFRQSQAFTFCFSFFLNVPSLHLNQLLFWSRNRIIFQWSQIHRTQSLTAVGHKPIYSLLKLTITYMAMWSALLVSHQCTTLAGGWPPTNPKTGRTKPSMFSTRYIQHWSTFNRIVAALVHIPASKACCGISIHDQSHMWHDNMSIKPRGKSSVRFQVATYDQTRHAARQRQLANQTQMLHSSIMSIGTHPFTWAEGTIIFGKFLTVIRVTFCCHAPAFANVSGRCWVS